MQINLDHKVKQSPQAPVTASDPMHKKVLLVGLGILAIVAIVLVVFKGQVQSLFRASPAPTKVITNAVGYPEGTQIKLYNQVPSSFPKNLWTGADGPKHVDVVNNPDGSTQTTVVYATNEKMQEAMDTVAKNLVDNQWRITQNNLLEKAGFITAVLGINNLTITFAPVSDSIQVTFQFTQATK